MKRPAIVRILRHPPCCYPKVTITIRAGGMSISCSAPTVQEAIDAHRAMRRVDSETP